MAIGRSVRRMEDARLLAGRGLFTANRDLPGQAHAVLVRSPHAHARIAGIDSVDAARRRGVIAVLDARDLAADGIGSLPTAPMLRQKDGKPMADARWPLLAGSMVRHVGDAVAVVIAETPQQACDAAEAIAVEYQPADAVTDALAAVAPGAAQVWTGAPGNVAAWYECGDRAAVEDAFRHARYRVSLAIANQRLAANPIETRVALASYDGSTGVSTLYCTSQHSHLVRNQLAEAVFRVPRERVRVVVGDIGGGFGMKAGVYPEYGLVVWASRRLGRPVKWVPGRSESIVSDAQGRDLHTDAELALDGDGRFLAVRLRSLANVGAYLTWLGPVIPTIAGTKVISNAYRIPAIHAEVQVVMTHTTPVEAYRGAGRPEYVFAIERLVDAGSRVTGIDAVELRRRNLIARADMPYTTALGDVYDSGNFEQVMDAALAAADWNGFDGRRRAAAASGRLLGRGLAYYVESTGAANPVERAELVASAAGTITLLSGTQAMGQGLETSYAQILAESLQLPLECMRIVQGDTALIRSGGGSGGSRSLFIGGSAVRDAADALLAEARRLAADALEVATLDVEYSSGRFRLAGTDRSIGLFELAARQPGERFGAGAKTTVQAMSWPNGCHVCEAEVDPGTGEVAVSRFVAVDDVGTVVNPMIVHGQVHGGVAQGIGQALMEHCRFDEGSGQLLTGSFMDYAMPRADDCPDFEVSTDESSPCLTNRLGAKGAGEGGAIGAPPAVVSAVLDALGVDDAPMPLTSEKVWRLLRQRTA